MPEIVKRAEPAEGRRFLVVQGDLLREPVDAIVNAANGWLAHGGGIAAVISRAAGGALDDEGRTWVEEHGAVPTGEAVVTSAGRLDFRGVIHAVGPSLGMGDEEARLTDAVANSLLRAHEHGWRSVSFPAISSGIFAVPHDVCARAYVAGVKRHFQEVPDSSLQEVRCCLLPGPLVALVTAEVERGDFPGRAGIRSG